MSKLIQITQNVLSEYDVPISFVNKIYNIINRKETINEENIDFNNSNFIGKIYLNGPTYQEYIDKINEYFRYLEIHPTSVYIKFKDSVVEQILLNAGIGDGTGITYDAAANATSLPSFRDNTDITSFDELKYFTKINRINQYTFSGCTNLVSIDLSNVTRVDWAAFYNCSSLETITDLSRCTVFEGKCFAYCTSLTDANDQTINFRNVTTLSWDSVFVCASITGDVVLANLVGSTPEPSFANTQIRSITYGPGVTGTSGGRIQSLNWINNISSPNLLFVDLSPSKVTKIEDRGFNSCTTLKLIKLPSTITQMGNLVFSNCTSLESIVLYATTPPSYSGEEWGDQYTYTAILFNVNKSTNPVSYSPPNANVKLYVPKESLNTYKTDAVWGKYADITYSIEDDYVDPDYYHT